MFALRNHHVCLQLQSTVCLDSRGKCARKPLFATNSECQMSWARFSMCRKLCLRKHETGMEYMLSKVTKIVWSIQSNNSHGSVFKLWSATDALYRSMSKRSYETTWNWFKTLTWNVECLWHCSDLKSFSIFKSTFKFSILFFMCLFLYSVNF